MSKNIKPDSKTLRKNALTKRQRAVLEYIKKCIVDRGIVPTIREICEALEIRSPNGVVCHLAALQRKGFIERKTNSSRAIVLKDTPRRNFLPTVDGVIKNGMMYTGEEIEVENPIGANLPIMSTENRIIAIDSNEFETKYGIRKNDYLLIRPAKIPEQEKLNIVRNFDGTYDILRFNEIANRRFSDVFAVVIALLRNRFEGDARTFD